jgi:hypothetical protein
MSGSRVIFIIAGATLFCFGLYKLLSDLGVIGGYRSPPSSSGFTSGTDLNTSASSPQPGYGTVASTASAVDPNWLRGDGHHHWQPACGPGSPYVFFGADSYMTQDNYGTYTVVGNVVRLQPHDGALRLLYITRIDDSHMDVVSNGQSMRMTSCLPS